MNRGHTDQHDKAETVPFSAALSGHLFLAVLKAPVAFGLLWLATLLPLVGRQDLATLIIVIIATYAGGEVMSAIFERPFVVNAGLPSPGGWGYALVGWWTTPVVGIIVGWLMVGHSTAAALATFIAVAIPGTVEAILSAPWQPGETRLETHERYEEFKAMTKESFADDADEIKRRAREKTKESYYKTHPDEKPK